MDRPRPTAARASISSSLNAAEHITIAEEVLALIESEDEDEWSLQNRLLLCIAHALLADARRPA